MKKIRIFPENQPLALPLFAGACAVLFILCAVPSPAWRELARNLAEGIGVGLGMSLIAYYSN